MTILYFTFTYQVLDVTRELQQLERMRVQHDGYRDMQPELWKDTVGRFKTNSSRLTEIIVGRWRDDCWIYMTREIGGPWVARE